MTSPGKHPRNGTVVDVADRVDGQDKARFILHNRSYALLWSAAFVSRTGNWVMVAALPLYLYEATGSVVSLTWIWVGYYLPGLVLGNIGGVLADRYDRRLIMMTVNVIQAVAILPLVVLSPGQSIWVAYVCTFVSAAASQFFIPAEHALLPSLVRGESAVAQAYSLDAVNNSVTRIAGPAVGGVVMAALGINAAAAIDMSSFLLSALLIGLIRPGSIRPCATEPDGGDAARPAAFADWVAGMRAILGRREVSVLMALSVVTLTAEAFVRALLVPYVVDVLDGGAGEVGLAHMLTGAAGVLGGLVCVRLARRVSTSVMLTACTAGVGLTLLVQIFSRHPPVVFTAIFVAGLFTVGWMSAQQALLQALTVDAHRGRTFGAYASVNMAALLVGSIIASQVADGVGPLPVMFCGALLFILASGLRYALRNRGAEVPKERHDG